MSGSLNIYSGEIILFVILAVVMLAAAIYGLLITRHAVHSAASMIIVMVGLAVMYTMLEAPFMGVVQVAVYTGAILMMFLFVLMMIGVDASESAKDILPGQRILAGVAALGTFVVLAWAVLSSELPQSVGLKEANGSSNPSAVARGIFGSHLITMELAGALLVVAALGAMILTHRELLRRPATQEEIVDGKMKAYAESGRHPGQKPTTGVYAESNSAANPALSAEGKFLDEAVPRMLRVRGQTNDIAEISPTTVARIHDGSLEMNAVGHSRMLGMGGEEAPVYPSQNSALQSADSSDEEETK
ncbi:MAG: NADH-quinone oxidoreductase subunit J [Actinomycetaceae bacterium]|nr:NADH-quinone oxidoreductase subunit J [Actinomycetaceae bacterium]